MTGSFILVIWYHIRRRRGSIISYLVGMITSNLVILFCYFVRNMITFTHLAPSISLLIMLLKMMAIIIFVSFDPYWRKIALNLRWVIMPPATLTVSISSLKSLQDHFYRYKPWYYVIILIFSVRKCANGALQGVLEINTKFHTAYEVVNNYPVWGINTTSPI